MKLALKTKAYAATSSRDALAPFEIERRQPGPADVLIEIKYCGVCHSDIHQARDEWGGAIFPMVPGHEIAGVVLETGSNARKFKPGDRVGVGCMVNSCRSCDSCQSGLEQYCHDRPVLTYNGLERDGVTPTYGGYSTRIVVDENFVVKIPDNLPLDAAAPLLCAGITTYSPLKHWHAGPGKRVAVVGFGGLGHMAVKIANAMGADVTVLSQSLKKKNDAERMGAKGYYATAEAETFTKLVNRFDLIINTISAPFDANKYLGLLRRDGCMVLVGAPSEPICVQSFKLIGNRRSFAGSAIGGLPETQEMLDFCAQHAVTADIKIIPIQQINQAYERMLKGDVRYRFVIDIASLS